MDGNQQEENETFAIFTSPDDYAYHIGQVARLGTQGLMVVRRNLSITTPYKIEVVPWDRVERARYDARLAPFRIFMGVALLLLLAGILYYLGRYWYALDSGATFRLGFLILAATYGLRWAFMSRRHRLTFHLRDGSKLRWVSRSGDFKYKAGAVNRGVERLTELRLLTHPSQPA